MLSGRNELIAIGALVVYIAFIPCPYAMKDFFTTSFGKAVALGVFVYAFKYVSEIIAILLLVNFLRSGGVREYLEETTGMSPSTTITDYKCPDEFMYDAGKKMCMKGTESKAPECTDSTMTWNPMEGKCVAKPQESSGGPPGGTTPGAMAAQTAMANALPSTVPPVTEPFTPYSGKGKQDFASL